jgi:pimeloyl-ACP methyl ester carboxylesterase
MQEIITKTPLVIKNSHNDDLFTDFYYPENKSGLPLVVFCHGFKGFKDWGSFPYVFDRIASAGNFVVAFNFSYNGTGETPETMSDFARLNLFAENTFSRELDDLGSLLNFLEENKAGSHYDFENLTLVGHSRGGGIVILKAAEDKRVKKLISLASVANFDRYSERHKQDWKERGFFEVMNTRTKQRMRLNYSLLEDLEEHKDRLDIEKAASKINILWLIVHGTEDLAVDYSNAEMLYGAGNSDKKQLVIMEKTGHTFGAVHPFEDTTDSLEKIITLIMDFLK